MTQFLSLAEPMRLLIGKIIQSDDLHGRWLNTLSYLENCGARKIAACEHPTQVKEEMLKHAAEEFRHAHHLKRQIERVTPSPLPDYSLPHLLGGMASLHYLRALDLKASRFLKAMGLSKEQVKAAAYLVVTYAIELRAEELYPLYDEQLRRSKSKVIVKSILLEEKEHLNEMREELKKLPLGFTYAQQICRMEGELCRRWLNSISTTLL